MPIKKSFDILAYKSIISFVLAGIVTGCSSPANLSEVQNKLEKQNTQEQVVESINTTSASCPVIESRNWHAWIDRVAENEPRLIVSGEVDLPTSGYEVEWRSGILDRLSSNGGSQPPAQRLSVSFTPPDGIVAQVVTPTEVSFTMPSLLLEYSSVMIYCGDKLLADLPDVVPTD